MITTMDMNMRTPTRMSRDMNTVMRMTMDTPMTTTTTTARIWTSALALPVRTCPA